MRRALGRGRRGLACRSGGRGSSLAQVAPGCVALPLPAALPARARVPHRGAQLRHDQSRVDLGGPAGLVGHREADLLVHVVVDGVELLQERDSEDEEWALGRGHVEGHQGHLAAVRRLIDVVFRLEVQDLVIDKEPEPRQLIEVRAVGHYLQPIGQFPDDIGRPCQFGRPCVHGHVTFLTYLLRVVVDSDVRDHHFPIARIAGNGHPMEVRRHVVAVDATECDFGDLRIGGRQEDRVYCLVEQLCHL
mmetsp:Transcript_89312/g.236173  ORF Transcript_89312/g.236173 Transcript_89312/m.236173 type:complete len:247 (-) Transcript_89312:867-1607(-)